MEILVNRARRSTDAPESETLLRVLREEWGLTGTKSGCQARRCGACTVLIDDRPALSCSVAVDELTGREVTTVEGLRDADDGLHPVQQAFLDEQAAQCGWCTPAQLLTAVALLQEQRSPSEELVRERLSAVLCRCGTYQRAIAAVLRAAARRAPEEHGR